MEIVKKRDKCMYLHSPYKLIFVQIYSISLLRSIAITLAEEGKASCIATSAIR